MFAYHEVAILGGLGVEAEVTFLYLSNSFPRALAEQKTETQKNITQTETET